MAFAPASMVRLMLSLVGPPVAMIGISGYFARIFATTSGVFPAAEIFRIPAPAAILASMSVFSSRTVMTTGMSTILLIS